MEQVLLSRIQTLLGTKNRVSGAVRATQDGDNKGQLEVMSFDFDKATLNQIEQLVARAKQQLSQVRVCEISHNYQDLLRTGGSSPAGELDDEERSADWQYHDLATSLDELAELLLELNYYAIAISAYRRALDLRTSAIVAGPASPLFSEAVDWRVERAASHFKIARALKKSGAPEAAAAAQTMGQQILDESTTSDHDAFALETFADQLEETALSAIDASDDAGAARCLSESLDLRLRAAQSEPDDTYFAKRFIESATEYSETLVGSHWRVKARQLVDQRANSAHPITGADQILARAAVMGG